MKQPRTKIARAIADKTLKSGTDKRFSQELAAYLLSERRVSDLESILRDVQAEWADKGFVEVIASSAHVLTPEIRSEITAQVKGIYPEAEKIAITEVHDPEVIGGVRLNLANKQLDLSVEAKLNKFKQLTLAGKE